MKKAAFFLCCLLLSNHICPAQKNSFPVPDAASARAQIASVLQLYQNHGKGLEEANYKDYLHSSLIRLLDTDNHIPTSGGELPYAAHLDVICECEVYQGIWNLKLESIAFKNVPVVNKDMAYVMASFLIEPPEKAGFSETRIMFFTLQLENGVWKIYDAQNLLEDSATTRKWLTDEIEAAEAKTAVKKHK